MAWPKMSGRAAAGTQLHSTHKHGDESSKPNKQSSTENEHSEHALSRMEIEVHRGGPNNEITGHTVKHHFRSTPSKSGAFSEYKEPESYVFDGNGHSGTHGHLADHMAEHMPHLFGDAREGGAKKGMIEAENTGGQGDDDQHSTYEA